jgi:phosphoglycolate phosphatase
MTGPGSSGPGPLRCVIFDFDGVLVASNAAKRQAYFQIFQPLGGLDAEIRAALADPSCRDRFDVIGRVLKSAPLDRQKETSVAALSDRYNEICLQAQAYGPECAGAARLLPRWADRFGLCLNSATPEGPLQEAVAARGWTGHFRGIYGRPHDKVANIERALAVTGADRADAVMVGDSRGDLQAAQSAGCRFIGVRSDGNDFTGDVPLVSDLDELDRILARSYEERS